MHLIWKLNMRQLNCKKIEATFYGKESAVHIYCEDQMSSFESMAHNVSANQLPTA